uniref:hypothetical protein n=1 Tax=Thaumasiovibrio occultus TaxID=1891184 RepID=UPI000B3565BB|nr:hypothetical protein [Thaumasiovibrio occultus]
MEIIAIIILIFGAVLVFPVLAGVVESRNATLNAIIEVEEGQITIRRFAVERLLRLKGSTVRPAGIVRVQFAANPMRGTCVSLFNQSNGALDFWVPNHLAKAVRDQLERVCPQATFVEV